MTETAVREHRAERPDTPREAYTLLPGRLTIGVVAALVLLGGAGWAYTIRDADRMSAMVMGLGQVGGGMNMVMALPSFLVMWAAMMVAMMSPTLAPVTLAHQSAVRDRGNGVVPTVAFVIGFLLVWAATGLVALAPYLLIMEIPASADDSRWLPAVAGAVLVGVGAFQVTPWKMNCLRMCRTPVAAVRGMDPLGSFTSSLRTGLAHGWHCLGCCWALMVVLLVVGVMNLAWMAVIAAIFLVDRHWAHGEGLTQAAGAFLIVLGLAVIAFPDLLSYVSGVDADAPRQMDNMGGM